MIDETPGIKLQGRTSPLFLAASFTLKFKYCALMIYISVLLTSEGCVIHLPFPEH